MKAKIEALRLRIATLSEAIQTLHKDPTFYTKPVPDADYGNIHANLTLAYRHLEDAGIRLGLAVESLHGVGSTTLSVKMPSRTELP